MSEFESRVQTSDYSYVPTVLPADQAGKTGAYEAILQRGKQYAIDLFQKAIDRCGLQGYDVAGIQLAFDECIPFIFKGDLTRDDHPRDWSSPLHKAMNLKVFGSEKVDLLKMDKRDRIRWHSLATLINMSLSFHTVSDEFGDAKLDQILLPEIENFINNLEPSPTHG